ncbi:MAG TPA: extensin family protein [Polyangiales bacterium]|nr:extensin family protein [Polyangiales bacterium]
MLLAIRGLKNSEAVSTQLSDSRSHGLTGPLRRHALLAAALLLGGCSPAALNELRGDPYPLDEHSRDAASDEPCPAVELMTYAGTALRFRPAVRVASPFVAHLQRFERVALRVALQTYGRAPATVRHAGTYVCRPVRSSRAGRWSEHAFGNAIDVIGFDFERAAQDPKDPAASSSPASLPVALRRRFVVRVAQHWAASSDASVQLHGTFLRRLAAALADENVFRAMIGPSDPRHRTHLHCDMGPWRYQNI